MSHVFFSKAYRKTLTIPNYIVVQSQPDDDPQYSGFAQDSDSVSAFRQVRQTEQVRLESNAQATSIATALLSKYQLNAEIGAADVPMNVGSEVFDYVKVTDSRESDYRVGNIGSIRRHYKPGQYSMNFRFGGWFSVRTLMQDLEVYPSGAGSYGYDFQRLSVKDLLVENIQADSIDMVWLDPSGNIDLSLIGDDLDSLADGETYARVKSLHLSAGQIKLDNQVWYDFGYNPTAKFDLASHNLDWIPEGTTYQRLLATDIQAGHLKLTSDTVIDGEWYDESGVEIDATHGINIYGQDMAFTTRATKDGTIQCKVDAAGAIIAGAGNIVIDETGIKNYADAIKGYYGETLIGWLTQGSTQIILTGNTGKDVALATSGGGDIYLVADEGQTDILCYAAGLVPNTHLGGSVGYVSQAWSVANIWTVYSEDLYPIQGSGYGAVGVAFNYWGAGFFGVLRYKSIGAFQHEDDIGLIKAMKPDKVNSLILDRSTLPQRILDDTGEFIDAGAAAGLALGGIRQLAERVEILEARR